uniref:Uncharacterized protein n=1 Tax=Xenopus tropicalis TaxID=8364 RepID=A0A803KAW2_XENTR
MERTGTARSPCLLSNWVEERATASLDCDSSAGTGTGHRGILTPELLAKLMDSTTYRDSYTQLPGTSNCQRGQREELLKKFLYEKFRKEILSEINSSAQEPTLTESTTKRDYQVEGFIPRKPQPSRTHDYRTEQPVTFWAENVRSITVSTPLYTEYVWDPLILRPLIYRVCVGPLILRPLIYRVCVGPLILRPLIYRVCVGPLILRPLIYRVCVGPLILRPLIYRVCVGPLHTAPPYIQSMCGTPSYCALLYTEYVWDPSYCALLYTEYVWDPLILRPLIYR